MQGHLLFAACASLRTEPSNLSKLLCNVVQRFATMSQIPIVFHKPAGSRSQVLASQNSSLSARHRSPDLVESDKLPGTRSWNLAKGRRPPLQNRPRSLGELSEVSRTSSTTELGKQYKSWASSRADEARSRLEHNASELRWRHARQTYRQTKKQYEIAIDPYKNNAITSTPKLANLRELFELDRAFLEDQAIEFTRRRQNLEVVQQILQRNEMLFMEAARQTMQPDPYIVQSTYSDSQATHALPYDGNARLASPSLQIDSRLTDFYDKEAQMNISGERLADLNYDYNEALWMRQSRVDRGETLSVTDDDFEAQFELERIKTVQALDRATKEVEDSKAVCDAAGIDVEAHRSNVEDHDDATLTDAQFARQEQYQLPFQETTSHMPKEAFDNAETIEDISSDHASDTLVEPLREIQGDDRLNKWIESLSA